MLRTHKSMARQLAGSSLNTRFSKHVSSKCFHSQPEIEFIKDHDKYTVTTYARPDIVFAKGQGSYLWDVQGKKYVDFMSGIAVTALGHSNPEVCQIISSQSSTLMHSSNLYHNEWTPRLARALVTKTKESGAMKNASRAFIANSGSEANEAAIKFARKWGNLRDVSGNKFELVSFNKSFHGRTYGALSVTANRKYWEPFRPMLPGVKVGDLNDISALPQLVNERTCGVIVEPIQGEGGVNVASKEFMVALRNRCNDVGALLIYDEIQCGLGRTGDLWAHTALSEDAHPDILTMAKALGNGFPVSAAVVTESVEKILKVGDHGTTHGGNVLASRVGHFVLSRLSNPEFLAKVSRKSDRFRSHLDKLCKNYPQVVSGVRGRGLLLGLQLTTDPTPYVKAAAESGLLLITCGTNTIRLVPALNIPDSTIEEGMAILHKVFASTRP